MVLVLLHLYLVELALQALDHLVASQFFIRKLFEKSFVHTLKWLFDLGKH